MNEDKIIYEILTVKADVAHIKDAMATKADFNHVLQVQDEMMVILKRLDQERVFTF